MNTIKELKILLPREITNDNFANWITEFLRGKVYLINNNPNCYKHSGLFRDGNHLNKDVSCIFTNRICEIVDSLMVN